MARVNGKRTPPNILLLLSDQHRHDWMSTNPALGSGRIHTPNLDWLAAGGMRFSNCHTAAPLCGPSRACLASGVHYDDCGMVEHETDWPFNNLPSHYRMMRDNGGYHVIGAGKFDLNKFSQTVGVNGGFQATGYGFSQIINNMGKWDGYNNHKSTGSNSCPYYAYLDATGARSTHINDMANRQSSSPNGRYTNTATTALTDGQYIDNWLADNARTLIANAPRGTPWYCAVNFSGPHEPMDITASMDSRRTGYPAPYDHSSSLSNHNDIRRNYTAMIENIDARIGDFITDLADSGQLENTIIIYTSDHGEMLGDHDRWEKKCPYHQSVGVPLIVRGPGVQSGVVSDALVNLIDIGATAMDYAGVAIPTAMQSRSLRPVLEGQTATHRDYVLSGLAAWRMVYDGRYKLIRGFDINSTGNGPGSDPDAAPILFDRDTDPNELTNSASSNPAKVRELSAILDRETHGIPIRK